MTVRLRDVTQLLDQRFPPSWAEPWDRVGLVCGDPEQPVQRILFAVDPVAAVVEEAIEYDADLLVVHHPLFLSPVHSVAATTPKGRVVHDLVRHGIALFSAHTNADVPAGGVNEALARAVGLQDPRVLLATDAGALDKLVVFVPVAAAEGMREALADAGAGAIGDYDSCTFTTPGQGRFRPLAGANPAVGTVGSVEEVDEVRIETVLPRSLRHQVVAAMRAAHPYEEPAFDLVELADLPGRTATRGHGRIGELAQQTTLAGFAASVAAALPMAAHGVRVAGDPDRVVRTVAVGAGSGDSLLEDVLRSSADVYLTSDLRHHRAGEFLEHGGAALVDVAHWAAEWTWLPVVEQLVRETLLARGDTVDSRVSTIVTDPWTFRAG